MWIMIRVVEMLWKNFFRWVFLCKRNLLFGITLIVCMYCRFLEKRNKYVTCAEESYLKVTITETDLLRISDRSWDAESNVAIRVILSVVSSSKLQLQKRNFEKISSNFFNFLLSFFQVWGIKCCHWWHSE